ncbi:MAG: Gfo/Idh/MocA family oxidoreductase, partial [Clostridia bacterium]|nr:Gfo/Idh/MocA family oxidoreductase [Clostridia bacterium]
MQDNLNAFMENQETVTVDLTKKVRIGIIGTGGIAHSHMKAYLKCADVEIVAGADLVPGKAEAFMKEFGIENAKCYGSCEEMLADLDNLKLDGVSICTYNRQHAPCAIAALNAGLNVILEKPFTVTTEEAVEVMRAEKKSGKILSIGFQPRFDDNMRMVKDIVRSGVLGKIYYMQTGGGRRRGIPLKSDNGVFNPSTVQTFLRDDTAGIGALGDIGCYAIDVVLNAIGYPKPLTATGFKSNFFGKDPAYCRYEEVGRPEYADQFSVDDFAAGFVRLEGGIILDFRIAWAMNINTPGDTIIPGTKGGLRIPSTDCWNGTIGGDLTLYHEVAGKQVETTFAKTFPKPGDPSNVDKKIRTFVDAIKNGTEAPVPTSQILYNQAILDHIKKSAEVGHEIPVVIPEI